VQAGQHDHHDDRFEHYDPHNDDHDDGFQLHDLHDDHVKHHDPQIVHHLHDDPSGLGSLPRLRLPHHRGTGVPDLPRDELDRRRCGFAARRAGAG